MLDVGGGQLGDCPFCDAAEDGSSPCWRTLFEPDDGTDIIWSGSHYLVMADTAPVVKGHVLIVPQDHVTSIAQMSPSSREELANAREWVSNLLESSLGAPTFFEHGAADSVHAAGACVDHAHLHAIPGKYDVVGVLLRDFPNLKNFGSPADALRHFANGPYIYYEEPGGRVYGAEAPLCSTQYLRRIFSAAAGHPERWNWRDCIRLASVLGTRNDVQELQAVVVHRNAKGVL